MPKSQQKTFEEFKSFIPFVYDDEGYISILFYFISPLDSDRGNIIVDRGISKLFTKLGTEGTSNIFKILLVLLHYIIKD